MEVRVHQKLKNLDYNADLLCKPWRGEKELCNSKQSQLQIMKRVQLHVVSQPLLWWTVNTDLIFLILIKYRILFPALSTFQCILRKQGVFLLWVGASLSSLLTSNQQKKGSTPGTKANKLISSNSNKNLFFSEYDLKMRVEIKLLA